MKRTLIDIQNEITRTRGNLEAINRHPFSEKDREILEPKYQADIARLQKEEKLHKTEVVDPKIVTV
jgi:hypothetical protein